MGYKGKEYYISNGKITAWVKVDKDDIIRDCAPVYKKFKNQPLSNLQRWSSKTFGMTVTYVLSEESNDREQPS